MKNNYILVFFFSTSFLFAQSDAELDRLQQLDAIATAVEKYQPIEGNSIPNQTLSTRSITDADMDGMDDNWEISNGLNPQNPKDAFADKDGDTVWNLFEFQLQTNPQNPNSPSAYSFDTNTAESTIKATLDRAGSETIYIRFAEGNYDFEYLEFYASDYRLMIQGGWNSNFSTFDPEIYKTTFETNESEVFDISGPFGEIVNYGAAVFQGLNFTKSGGFSLSGPIEIHTRVYEGYISVVDCHFYDNNYYGIGYFHKDDVPSNTNFYVIKCTFSFNQRGGIYSQITEESNTNWHIIHSTFNNPNCEKGAVDAFTLGNGNMNIDVINSIFWENEAAFTFQDFHQVNVNIDHSLVSEIPSNFTNYTSNQLFTFNPQFKDPFFLDFNLQTSSPCIDKGIDLGLPYSGITSDLGAEEYGSTSSIAEITDNQFDVWPNPVNKGQSLYIKPNHATPTNLSLSDATGKMVWQKQAVTTSNPIKMDFRPGVYFLSIQTTGGISTRKIIVQ